MAGNLKLLAGLAAGYVLGARAGRERYERIAEATRRLAERPEVREVTGKLRSGLGAGLERAAGTASDRLQQARGEDGGPAGQPRAAADDAEGAGGTPAGPRQRPAPPAAAVGSGAAVDASADARTPVAQESFLGRPQGRPSTTTWATSATGRRDDLAADRMRR
jgi:hypothetical protein